MRDEYYIPKPTESAVMHDATPKDRETEAYRRGVMKLKEWHRICAKKREKAKKRDKRGKSGKSGKREAQDDS